MYPGKIYEGLQQEGLKNPSEEQGEQLEETMVDQRKINQEPHPDLDHMEVPVQKELNNTLVSYSNGLKPRIEWTPQLHATFDKAINKLGGPSKATPLAIMEEMNTEGLTICHLKSHLQKFTPGTPLRIQKPPKEGSQRKGKSAKLSLEGGAGSSSLVPSQEDQPCNKNVEGNSGGSAIAPMEQENQVSLVMECEETIRYLLMAVERMQLTFDDQEFKHPIAEDFAAVTMGLIDSLPLLPSPPTSNYIYRCPYTPFMTDSIVVHAVRGEEEEEDSEDDDPTTSYLNWDAVGISTPWQCTEG